MALAAHPSCLPVTVGRLAGRDRALLRSKGAMCCTASGRSPKGLACLRPRAQLADLHLLVCRVVRRPDLAAVNRSPSDGGHRELGGANHYRDFD